jgi:polysaccharide biosynthesis transport protein
MELRQYIHIIRKWLWLIILSVGIAAASSYFASQSATPVYQTKTTLMVGRATQNPDPNSAELYTGQQLAYTYMQLVKRQPVLKGAIDSLGLQMEWYNLVGQVNASIIPQTQLIEISVIDNNPNRAKLLADAIAQQLILQSPSGARVNAQEEGIFISQQIEDVKAKIKNGQQEIDVLRLELDEANSASQIQNLENQISILEAKITGWQQLYSQLLISYQGGDVNTLSVIEEAYVPLWPISPNVKMNVLIAAVIGLILSAGGAILIEYFDDTVKNAPDLERATKIPSLGMIGRIDGKEYDEKLIAVRNPRTAVVESFRVIRTNIQSNYDSKPLRTILFTGPGPKEGKSLCVANLAAVMAQSGVKVILVDADLRCPVQHKIFNLDNQDGLTNVLLGPKQKALNSTQATAIPNLHILCSGPSLPNPSDWLGSERMKAIIDQLVAEVDIVLFDTPPVLAVADPLILAQLVDGVILVTRFGRTRMTDVKKAVGELLRVRTNLLGSIINKVPLGESNYYYHYYPKNGTVKNINIQDVFPSSKWINHRTKTESSEHKKTDYKSSL